MSSNPFIIYDIKSLDMSDPPMVWALWGMIAVPSVHLVVGTPEAHKTNAIMDMCVSMVKGIDWLGKFKTEKLGVLWLDMDNSPVTTRKRLRALRKHHKLDDSDPFNYMTLDPGTIKLHGSSEEVSNSTVALGSWIEKTGAKVIVIDNFWSISGNVDEKSSDGGRIFLALRTISNKYQVAIIVLHHLTKGDNGGSYSRADRISGHASIRGAIDSAMFFDRKEHSNRVTVYSIKNKNADQFEPFAIYYNYTQIPGTKDLDEFWFTLEDLDSGVNRAKHVIMELLKTGKKKTEEIVMVCKPYLGRNNVLDLLKELVEGGKVLAERDTKKKNAKFYSLPPDQMILPDNADIVHYNHEIELTGKA